MTILGLISHNAKSAKSLASAATRERFAQRLGRCARGRRLTCCAFQLNLKAQSRGEFRHCSRVLPVTFDSDRTDNAMTSIDRPFFSTLLLQQRGA
jgi:hypothetical protein